MQIRAFSVAAFVAASALGVALACSSNQTLCESGQCAGCCDADGLCQPGDQVVACGVSSQACQTCANTSCVAGLCIGGPPDAGPIDGGYATVLEMCADLPIAWCGVLARCGAATSVADCLAAQPNPFPQCERDWVPAVNEGRASFNRVKAVECVNEIRSIDVRAEPKERCIPRDFFEELASCRDAIKGNIVVDGQCYSHAECLEELYCTAACPGTCQARKTRDQFVLSDRDCVQGMYRYLGNSTCQTPVDGGADCAPLPTFAAPQKCELGFQCNQNEVCAPWVELNQACSGFNCRPLLTCPVGGGGCKRLAAPGGDCFDDYDCKVGLICVFPPDGGISRQCTAKHDLGELCEEPLDCKPDLYCDQSCKPQKNNDEACTTLYECKSLNCQSNFCEESGCHDPTP
jgi:hypothetical protein